MKVINWKGVETKRSRVIAILFQILEMLFMNTSLEEKEWKPEEICWMLISSLKTSDFT